jgi:hypothetical protein
VAPVPGPHVRRLSARSLFIALTLSVGGASVASAQADSVALRELRDSLAMARAEYRALRDSLDARKPKVQIEMAIGPGIFYSFSEGKLVSGFGVAVGVKIATWRIF